jgi:hypothetical protein
MPWQDSFLRAPRGASILALTARQVGKTTTAAWAITHSMVFKPGSLSVIACPAQRQSAEAVRRVRQLLFKLGVAIKSDNFYAIELENGSRVLALPGSDDSIRGLTVDGWIVADEAARLSEDMIAALRPMRARCPDTRLAMLSTARSRADPFWTAWSSDDPTWKRLKATVDEVELFSPAYLEGERRNLGEAGFNREYLGIPQSDQASPFTWDLYERAIRVHTPLVLPGSAFRPPGTREPLLDQPDRWPAFHPLIIAHDVGRSRDRSTAVVGGGSPFQSGVVGLCGFEELPIGLYGSPRANALAAVDRTYRNNALIVVDLSNDASYLETLYDTFGPRLIGLQITHRGDGMSPERRPVRNGSVLVYSVGRSYLIERFHAQLVAGQVRFAKGAASQRAYGQLEALQIELRESGQIYSCLPGQHDDLGMSCCMLAFTSHHPHLPSWRNAMFADRMPRPPQPKFNWGAACC